MYQACVHCRRRRRAALQAAFTLMEFLSGLFVLTLTSLTLVPVFVSADQTMRRSQHLEQATRLAHEKIEAWRRRGFDALPTVSGTNTAVTEYFTSDITHLPSPFARTVVTRVDANLAPVTVATDRRRVAVTVSWEGRRRDQGSVTLTTLIVKP